MPPTKPDNSTPPVASRSSNGIYIVAILFAVGIGVLLWGRGTDNTKTTSVSTPLAGANFTENQRQSIQDIVKDYLLGNPELLLEMQSALELKLAEEEAERTKKLVSSHAKELYRNDADPVGGKPDGDIAVVEFFDYNCGYCKRGFDGIAKLIESDANVRFVFKELPIIRNESEGASRVALAAKRQGRYWEVHQALMKAKGLVNEALALKVAEELGLDMEKLKADANSDEVKAQIQNTKQLAQKMGINGTPHFLVGDKAVGGAPQNLYQVLKEHVAEFREAGCTYC